jgi:peptide/nickel transport system permease protein|tara:strand:- start:1190 stop:2068 length:879 start_codon:yes stop_codon:yes gene_type:complete
MSSLNPYKKLWSEFCENKIAFLALCILLVLIVLSLLSPIISPQDPYNLSEINILEGRLPPGTLSESGYIYVLGTDDQGRDMLSAILYGLRISLAVGVASGLFAFILGLTVGLFAAYNRGIIDILIMRFVDMQLSFPAILIALILLTTLGRGTDKVIIALIASQWVYYARVARGTALTELNKEYIESALCLNLSKFRIIIFQLLPNCLPPLIVVMTIEIGHAIALEATLSFLGVGLPITKPSLGLLISNGYEYMLYGKYWISMFPGIALLILILTINVVGDHLRDILNPRLKQ